MQREATTSLLAILGFLFIATLATFSAAVDSTTSSSNSATEPSSDSSFGKPSSDDFDDPLQRALYLDEDRYLDEESSTGLDLVPDLLGLSSPELTHAAVAHLQYGPPVFQDPHQLLIDRRKLAPPVDKTPSTWQASFDVLAASRLDEKISIAGQELGTGINAGARVRLTNRFDTPSNTQSAWDVIAIGLQGEDSLNSDPLMLYVAESYHYRASMVSVESNAIHRNKYKRRVREQFLGIRYIDHRDSIEESGFYPYLPSSRQRAHNRMLGLQVGLHQSWSNLARFRFSWGAKAGVFYNSVEQAGYVYSGTANSLPLLLDCHADLAYRVFEQAYMGIGFNGMRLDDQYQSRFAWQAPLSTHRLKILGLRLGFDYTY